MVSIINQILSYCHLRQIKEIILSPGARNGPLIVGFTADLFFTNHSVIDERAAGFYALGLAQATKNYVVLVCTSGSAVLNYLPAVAEAFYAETPLFIISADRPTKFLNQGHSQTIPQIGCFENFGIPTFDYCQDDILDIKSLEERYYKKLIIHLNIHLDEPLFDLISLKSDLPKLKPLAHIPKNIWHCSPKTIDVYQKSTKTLLILGQQKYFSPTLKKLIKQWNKSPCLLILCEQTTNFQDSQSISNIDIFLHGLESVANFVPDIIISFQWPLVSNNIGRLLRKSPNCIHINVGTYQKGGWDTFETNTFIWENTDPISFVKKIMLLKTPYSQYKDFHLKQHSFLEKKRDNILPFLAFSDLTAIWKVLSYIPKNWAIQVGNSTPIRYLQLYKPLIQNIYANRGTSGIEGVVSTAIGFAKGNKNKTILIVGDISFLYDHHLLYQALEIGLKIVILQNNGGDIFNIVPGPKKFPSALPYFITSQKVNFRYLCASFEIPYFVASNNENLSNILPDFIKNPTSSVLEIVTGVNNAFVLEQFWKAIKK